MKKAQKFDDIKRSKHSPEAKARVAARVDDALVAMTLADLRKELGLTQIQMAELGDMSQGQVSTLERRNDHLVSTIRKHVQALGGTLEITAVVGDKRVLLNV